MSHAPDLKCQWCHRTVAVALEAEPGKYMTVATIHEFEGKFYCDGESGTCWGDLIAMTKYVRDNFHD